MESRRTLAAPERMESVFACPADVSFRRSPGALFDIFRINLAHDLCSSFCDAPDSSLWCLRLKTKYGMSLKPSISRAHLSRSVTNRGMTDPWFVALLAGGALVAVILLFQRRFIYFPLRYSTAQLQKAKSTDWHNLGAASPAPVRQPDFPCNDSFTESGTGDCNSSLPIGRDSPA